MQYPDENCRDCRGSGRVFSVSFGMTINCPCTGNYIHHADRSDIKTINDEWELPVQYKNDGWKWDTECMYDSDFHPKKNRGKWCLVNDDSAIIWRLDKCLVDTWVVRSKYMEEYFKPLFDLVKKRNN